MTAGQFVCHVLMLLKRDGQFSPATCRIRLRPGHLVKGAAAPERPTSVRITLPGPALGWNSHAVTDELSRNCRLADADNAPRETTAGAIPMACHVEPWWTPDRDATVCDALAA